MARLALGKAPSGGWGSEISGTLVHFTLYYLAFPESLTMTRSKLNFRKCMLSFRLAQFAIALLVCAAIPTKGIAQWNYRVNNSSSCSASVYMVWQTNCSTATNNGSNTFTVAGSTTVTQSIPTGAIPVKIQVTIGSWSTLWTCPNTSFSPDPSTTSPCPFCQGGAENNITVQGYVNNTKIDCHP